MEIKVIITDNPEDTHVRVTIEGEATRIGLVHAVSEYLIALKQSTNLSLVTDGIEEFLLRLGKDDENE